MCLCLCKNTVFCITWQISHCRYSLYSKHCWSSVLICKTEFFLHFYKICKYSTLKKKLKKKKNCHECQRKAVEGTKQKRSICGTEIRSWLKFFFTVLTHTFTRAHTQRKRWWERGFFHFVVNAFTRFFPYSERIINHNLILPLKKVQCCVYCIHSTALFYVIFHIKFTYIL